MSPDSGAGGPTPPGRPRRGAGIGVQSRPVRRRFEQWYLALPDGVQQISPVAASVLRNVNTYGAAVAPDGFPDVVAHLPASSRWISRSRAPLCIR